MNVSSVEVNFTKAATVVDQRYFRHAAATVRDAHATGDRKFLTQCQCLCTVHDTYVPGVFHAKKREMSGKLRKKVASSSRTRIPA